MNVVMIIPTGIGCEIGGHAGDATPSARLVASACDNLLLHPNVINASDIAEITDNMWYIEGSILDRFLEGQISLQEVYSNKILLVVNKPCMPETINSVNAARSTLGVDIEILELDTELTLKGVFSSDGKATGLMSGHEEAYTKIVTTQRDTSFDVLAIQTVIDVDTETSDQYLKNGGINPWGGAEAVCSRFFSRELNIQCAHSPYEGGALKSFNEVVDPRMAAEVVSVSYLHCILKGLHKAPKILEYNSRSKDIIRVDDIDLMISPSGCWGRPHEACANWDIPILFVKENQNIYGNNKSLYRNSHIVDNYIEAAGIITAMKAGVTIESVRRPLKNTKVYKEI